MRRIALALVLVAAVSACNMFRRGASASAHKSPTTTSIYGNWVLASPIDSTAFIGASQVEMELEPATFRIVATYPGREATVISGTVVADNKGLVTLTPTTGGTDNVGAARSMSFILGQPISLLASAAGGTLVFKPPKEEVHLPSSVWNRREMAERAGKIASDSTP